MKANFRYDSRYETRLKQNIQETIEFILSKKYGETLYLTDLGKIMGYNINDEKELKKFKSQMGKVKNFLINYGYILKPVIGVGYFILKPQHIPNHCYRTYVTKSQRMLDKSLNVLEHVDKIELSEPRYEELANMMSLNNQLIETMENTIANSTYYSRKEYYNSLGDN